MIEITLTILFLALAVITYKNPKTGTLYLSVLTPFWIEFKYQDLSGIRIGYIDIIVTSALLAILFNNKYKSKTSAKLPYLIPFIGYNFFVICANWYLFEDGTLLKSLWGLYKVISFNLIYIVVVKSLDDEQTILKSIKLLMGAVFVMAVFAVLQRPFGNNFNLFAFGTYADDLKNSLFIEDKRVVGTFRSPNELAAFLIWPLSITTGLLLLASKNTRKNILMPVVAIEVLALLCTYSRTGWIAFLTVFTVLCMMCKRKLLLCSVFAVIVFLLIAQQMLFPDFGGTIVGRLISINKGKADYAMVARNERWDYYSKLVIKNPMGLGIIPEGDFSEAASPHNNYIYLSLMSGIPGMFCAMTLLFALIVTAYKNFIMSSNAILKGIFAGIFSGGIGFVIHGFFESLWQNWQMGVLIWLLLGITMSYNKILRQKYANLART